MKKLLLISIVAVSLQALPPEIHDWRSPQPEAPLRRSYRFGEGPTQPSCAKATTDREKDPNAEAEKVHAVSSEDIKNRVTAGCIEYTMTMLNGNLTKQERDQARWRLTNLRNHPYYDASAYDSRGSGRFPHSGNDTY